ncbi:hypothetical protein [Neobacillus sp. CF12]|uniref:hypothetical protein n=1 Tax=Neobacillus sp. CF12 TaxID=3055864 RepID=UPI0025A243AC|nr:hypothetical protein [Neobacillus sp. CF12]MDM5326815.1 hypothetical protein [Neobacillus sp. CF12]
MRVIAEEPFLLNGQLIFIGTVIEVKNIETSRELLERELVIDSQTKTKVIG